MGYSLGWNNPFISIYILTFDPNFQRDIQVVGVNNHGDRCCPLRIGLWDYFQMAELHGGSTTADRDTHSPKTSLDKQPEKRNATTSGY